MEMSSMTGMGERMLVTKVLIAFLAGVGSLSPSSSAMAPSPRRPFRFGDDARNTFTQETPEAAERA